VTQGRVGDSTVVEHHGAWVQGGTSREERKTMAQEPSRGSAAHLSVLFADISESSLMYAVRGDSAAFDLIQRCLRLLGSCVTQSKGRTLKLVGDGIIAVFDSAESAVDAAVLMLEALDEPSSAWWREGVRIRVGINAGRTLISEDDVHGDVVNVAARLLAHAGPNEIVLSDTVQQELPPPRRSRVRFMDELVLRGRPAVVAVYEYVWKQEDVTSIAGKRPQPRAGVLHVTYGDQEFTLSAAVPKLRIGRSPNNDITIDEHVVSRFHAEIVLRGQKFFLTDSSTNGTQLCSEGAEPVRVIRESVPLTGSGRILAGDEKIQPIYYALRAPD